MPTETDTIVHESSQIQKNMITKVFICINGDCSPKETALEVIAKIQEWILNNGFDGFDTPSRIKCIPCGCLDVCQQGPVVRLLPDNTTYWNITPTNIVGILEDHIFNGNICKENLASPKKRSCT